LDSADAVPSVELLSPDLPQDANTMAADITSTLSFTKSSPWLFWTARRLAESLWQADCRQFESPRSSLVMPEYDRVSFASGLIP
jgi:hypothetical protein